MRSKEFIKENRDIHIVAIDQMIDTEHGSVPNPDIKNWAAQTVDNTSNLAILWKNPKGKIEMDSAWFGNMVFDTLTNARDYIQIQYSKLKVN